MLIEYYHIDAFTNRTFAGNPAGVCLLDNWLPEDLMQKIAFENNLSETAFLVKAGESFGIRWFTPLVEVDLCGHATLSAAHVIFSHKKFPGNRIVFSSQSGQLSVEKEGNLLYLDFPARPPAPCPVPSGLVPALGQTPLEVLSSSRDYFIVFNSEEMVRNLQPDMAQLKNIDKFGFIVTAAGIEADFVSRFFCPGEGIPEDPVTGSSHCTLVPYWSKKLAKPVLTAHQVSSRGGRLYCRDMGERVKIGGQAVTYLHGWIEI